MAIFRKMNLETRKFNRGKALQFVNNHPQMAIFRKINLQTSKFNVGMGGGGGVVISVQNNCQVR